MQNSVSTLRVAVMQAASVIMNLESTMQKTLALIQQAADQGAELIVFPEAYIPGYPRGLSFGFVVGSRTMEGRQDWKRYYDNSIAVPGGETDRIAKAAKEAGAYISIGVIEKDANKVDRTL